ncbi:GNAT family N-acetyltransferase [Fulvivirga sp. 29W222]|uniref:GNAT family N-acetyltransferase n=1 Tax=Fulvivirga marina TaxID=2494733 RepID=A0A937FTD5_9BACT|nr:GNAT family N-acetyltransferase [Fulvivirga marina]MBL6445334.1 GNAT family N-acetyltransferase [Fulvivirga marina]
MITGESVLETERLTLFKLVLEDAPFILRIVNEPSWLQYIGDKKVRDLEGAEKYIEDGPLKSYKANGFGLYLVKLKNGTPIGLCGILNRDALRDPDIGFAFLPEYTGMGYAYESAFAVLTYGKTVLGLNRIVAITSPDNFRSGKLLEKLGLKFSKTVRLVGDNEDTRFYEG